jgi:hypothetical protein
VVDVIRALVMIMPNAVTSGICFVFLHKCIELTQHFFIVVAGWAQVLVGQPFDTVKVQNISLWSMKLCRFESEVPFRSDALLGDTAIGN